MQIDWSEHDWRQRDPVSDPAGGDTASDGLGNAALLEARLPAPGRATHGGPGGLEAA